MGYTPPGAKALLSSLSAIAPIEPVVYEEEPSQPAPVQKPKRVQGKKGKDGAAFAPATQSSAPAMQSSARAIEYTAPVLTCSATKAAVEAYAGPEGVPISAGVGSPFVAPSMIQPMASQSEAIVPSFRKRKVAAPDTSVISSGTIPISALIENVDMEDLMKVYQVNHKHDPIYICIQEFLTRVSLYILSCFYFVIAFSILQFM